MLLKKINTENKSDFEFVQKVYIESFPPNERRPLLEFLRLIDNEKAFTLYVLIDNDNQRRMGFLSYWTFDTFIFAEHFAISPEYRNEGYGKKVMDVFLKQIKSPLIIEVELPENEISQKRIDFYKRSGFHCWDIPYEQPPYESKYAPIPMKLMTYGAIDLNVNFDTIRNTIYSTAYNI